MSAAHVDNRTSMSCLNTRHSGQQRQPLTRRKISVGSRPNQGIPQPALALQHQGRGAAPPAQIKAVCRPRLWPEVEDSGLLGKHFRHLWLLLCDTPDPTQNRLSPTCGGEVACNIVQLRASLAAASSLIVVIAVNTLARQGPMCNPANLHWWRSSAALLSWRQVPRPRCHERSGVHCHPLLPDCRLHHMYAFARPSPHNCCYRLSCVSALRTRDSPSMSADGCQKPAWTGQAFSYLMHHPNASSGELTHPLLLTATIDVVAHATCLRLRRPSMHGYLLLCRATSNGG